MKVYSFDSKEVIPIRRCVITRTVNDKGFIVDVNGYKKCNNVKNLGKGFYAYEYFNRYTIIDINGRRYFENLFSDVFDSFDDGPIRVLCSGNHDQLESMEFGFCKDESYPHSTLSGYCNYLKPNITFVSKDWFYAPNCSGFKEGYAVVHSFEGDFFFIDKDGNKAFDKVFDNFFYIDETGNKVFYKNFDYAEPFKNGTALVRGFKEQNFGLNLINANGELLIKEETWPTDINGHTFVNGFLIVKKKADDYKSEMDKVYNYVSKETGKYLSKIWFKDAKNFDSDGFAKIIKLWLLYVDEEGNYHAEKKKGYHNKGVMASYIDKYGNLYDEYKNPLSDKFIEFLNKN